jgi:hypothetical protein
MRERLYCLLAAIREVFHPAPFVDDEDTVTPAAFRQWIADSKHPDACRAGCQCRPDRR